MTIGSAIALIAVGAILKWAVTAHVTGFNVQTAGTVLLVVGLVGLWCCALAFTRSGGLAGRTHRRRPPPGPPPAV